MSNRDRILELSLRLMNEEGAGAAGTTRIAAELGISPGNLYYHFRNREEIVRVLFEALETEFRAVLVEDVGPPISAARFATFYRRSFDLAWRYRFFFGGLLGLLRRPLPRASGLGASGTGANCEATRQRRQHDPPARPRRSALRRTQHLAHLDELGSPFADFRQAAH